MIMMTPGDPPAPAQGALIMTTSADDNPSSFRTTRVMALGNLVPGAPEHEVTSTMPREVRETVALYLAGTIDQWFAQQGGGVLFLLNLTDLESARSVLGELPLAKAGLMSFQLTALGPLTPLHALLQP
jgi:hypothetical protein